MPSDEQLTDLLIEVISTAISEIHTMTIAKITSVNEKTINCKPVINKIVDGESVEFPVFSEVPPIFLGGGSSYISFPIQKDDYCLLLITERCFDRWWDGKDFQEPLVQRMHDYSDGFALCGIKNFINLINIPQETTINGVMRLGNENPSDFVALAQKVLDELELIKTDLDGFKSNFDSHIHTTTATVGSGSTPGVISATSTPHPDPHTPGSVASSLVKAD